MLIEYAHGLIAPVTAAGYRLSGLYLHGSAALGGFRPSSSDVDVLAIVEAAGSAEQQRALGSALRVAAAGCPGVGLEMSVITVATARHLGHCPYEVHVATTPGDENLVIGAGNDGDPDLVLHLAVTRAHGLVVAGPAPAEVIAPIEPARIIAAILDELDWGAAEAPLAYAVLNACRALVYAYTQELVSKVDAGRWYLDHRGPDALVERAVAEQAAGIRTVPIPTAARRFVADAKRVVTATSAKDV
jgi:streptomycin 3"-adenylyltransferase